MTTKLSQVSQRVADLDKLAEEVYSLAERLSHNENVQPELSVKGQRWYRGSRELLIQHNFSGIHEFDECYDSSKIPGRAVGRRSYTDIVQFINRRPQRLSSGGEIFSKPNEGKEHLSLFSDYFSKARALVLSLLDEILSRELPVKTQLSFEVAATEFETAESIMKQSGGEEVFLRSSGVICRVALERHLFTVADSHGVQIILPAGKKKAEANDVMISLERSGVITAIQRSELESLFKIGNNCAHPKETVSLADIERLIIRGREISAIIL